MLDENISSYVYMLHMCFKDMASMCKKYKPMKNKFRAQFSKLPNWGMQVRDEFCIMSHNSPII